MGLPSQAKESPVQHLHPGHLATTNILHLLTIRTGIQRTALAVLVVKYREQMITIQSSCPASMIAIARMVGVPLLSDIAPLVSFSKFYINYPPGHGRSLERTFASWTSNILHASIRSFIPIQPGVSNITCTPMSLLERL